MEPKYENMHQSQLEDLKNADTGKYNDEFTRRNDLGNAQRTK